MMMQRDYVQDANLAEEFEEASASVPSDDAEQTLPAQAETYSAEGQLEQAAGGTGNSRPDGVPEKFWDAEVAAIRTDALLRSYQELERRLSRSVPKPESEDDAEGVNRLFGILGRPDTAEGYEIASPHPLVSPDPQLNELLHSAGFTQRQAQLVYDLAAERLLPLIDEAQAEVEATRQVDRLQQHFGGPEVWRTTSAQIKAYAEANISEELQSALTSSYEGVLALYEMMRKAEPDIVGQAGSGQLTVTEDSLREMIRDPRYWRDRDPEIVQRVTAGYRNLYPS
jgi:hypothetical protein